jgi:hypothetical protein
MKLLFVNVAKDLTSAQRGSLVALWLLSSVGFVGTQGCAHQPRSGPGAEAARTEIAQLEGNISSRRRQIPTLATAPASPDSVLSVSATTARTAPSSRCDGACVAAQAICGYSRRICELSERVGDEPSLRSCKKAERECQDASGLCASCR